MAPVIGSPDSLTIRHRRRFRRVSGLLVAPVWLPSGSPGRERFLMPIRIGDGFMRVDGRVIATATERAGGWWEVTSGRGSSTAPGHHRADGHRATGDRTRQRRPLVAPLREELR